MLKHIVKNDQFQVQHYGPMWERFGGNQLMFWEDFALKTSSLTPGKSNIKKATLSGNTNRRTCVVEFDLPSNVDVDDSFSTFVSFLAFIL